MGKRDQFNKNHLLNHRTKRFLIEEDDIDKIPIKTVKFEDLIEKYSITEIDKILIDIEGYEILRDMDLKKVRINSILFEYKHFDGYQKTGEKLWKDFKG